MQVVKPRIDIKDVGCVVEAFEYANAETKFELVAVVDPTKKSVSFPKYRATTSGPFCNVLEGKSLNG